MADSERTKLMVQIHQEASIATVQTNVPSHVKCWRLLVNSNTNYHFLTLGVW